MKYLSPRYIFSLSISIWIVLYLFSPIEYIYTPSKMAIIVIISYIFFFYLGTYLISLFNTVFILKGYVQNNNEFDSFRVKKIYNILFVVTSIGILLRFYDLLIVKSFFSYSSITDFRINYEANDSGIVSITSAILFPFGVALSMFTIYLYKYLGSKHYILSFISLMCILFYPVLRGGRTTLTLLFVIIAVSIVLTNPAFIKKQLKKLFIYVILFIFGLLFFVYSMNIIIDRLEFNGFTIPSHLEYMQPEYGIFIPENIIDLTRNEGIVAKLIYTLISLSWYCTHGLFEFFYLFDNFSLDNLVFGAQQFYPIFKFLELVGLSSITQEYLSSIVPMPGVYTTFYGPVFIDFGYLGFLYCFLLGVLIQYLWTKIQINTPIGLFLYPFFASVLLHSAFINMIDAGFGLYFLVSLIISVCIVKYIGIRVQ
ncbi:O-antigen polymerase [Paenibacillus thalictri]|uniref:Oligosaccharide repeat unit polymerase n=1 Tax=Paenibacillus thalictri TaxID=2527873 RepID=A0A4Q9DC63_9BACL|nr:O-antigen polymerase [Paenibacillus thalictri]TBL67772.1 oligosaccharide repeat unit polymerase [Paenibacillus thalictri]